jgi:carbamate kinase
VVTQVLVNPQDPAFKTPTKPVGPFLSREEAERRRDELGWQIVEDAGRGWRRVVPSPVPTKVVQRQMIRDSAEAGHIVIAAGGGGIPIIKKGDGTYEGVEAVIDKDLTSSILANEIGAEIFIILTEVPQVYTGYGTNEQRPIGAITSERLLEMHRAGEFPPGSMGPKVTAVREFLERGGKRAIITNPDTLDDALLGRGGTHIIGGC